MMEVSDGVAGNKRYTDEDLVDYLSKARGMTRDDAEKAVRGMTLKTKLSTMCESLTTKA